MSKKNAAAVETAKKLVDELKAKLREPPTVPGCYNKRYSDFEKRLAKAIEDAYPPAMNKKKSVAASTARKLVEELKNAVMSKSPRTLDYYRNRDAEFEKNVAKALEAASSPVAADTAKQDDGAEAMRTAIVAAKGKFSEFFKLANAGNPKGAGMCIMDAETLLTRSLMVSPSKSTSPTTSTHDPVTFDDFDDGKTADALRALGIANPTLSQVTKLQKMMAKALEKSEPAAAAKAPAKKRKSP